MKPNEYQCAACGRVLEKGWSDEEAAAERKENGFDDLDCVLVCDTCYKRMGFAPQPNPGPIKEPPLGMPFPEEEP